MNRNASIYTLLAVANFIFLLVAGSGCANIVAPTGGPRDSIPPVLVAETPMDSATNVTTTRFTFTFNEFVELQDAQQNVLISPTPVKSPAIDYKLRNVTVRLRDSLEPNTTYSINFGNAIKDINEGNVFKDFSYVFSTGNTIDAFTLSGNVVEAETGKTDSTLIVILHRNQDDSAVLKERPRYIARLNAAGNFTFRNLPSGTFSVYAMPDGFSRRFDETQLFAFADRPVLINDSTKTLNLFAYVERPKSVAITTPAPSRVAADKVLRFTTNLEGPALDLLAPLQLSFNRKIAKFDSTKIILTNKDFVSLTNYKIAIDTSLKKLTITHSLVANTSYNLLLAKDALEDSSGITLTKADTITYSTKKEEEYGSVKIRFNNLDVSKNPVLLIVQNNNVIQSVPLTQRDWAQKLYKPGEYDLRILYDTNKNGKWDAGEFFGRHRQPEIVKNLNTQLSVRANWDNEKEISLAP